MAKEIIGWREWLDLPDLKVKNIKAKIDTGARTSAIHATNVKEFYHGRKRYVEFMIHPNQDSSKPAIKCKAPMLEKRQVKSSTGHQSTRPVIETTIKLGSSVFKTEITLVNRDMMGFRMLLGRQALRNKFLVDTGKSFLINSKTKGRR